MRWDDILNALIELEKSNKMKLKKDQGWILVSKEGLPIASAILEGVNETRIAAMTAALLSLAEKSVIEMKNGEFDQLYIKGSNGFLLVLQVGPTAILAVSTTKDVRLGLTFLDSKRIYEKIIKIINNGFDFNDEEKKRE